MKLEASLGYQPSDPYAVTVTFRTAGGDVIWTFARDLLTRGLTAPAGEGDVHVWPCLNSTGRAVVIIELRSPDGELLVQAPALELTAFVNRTLALVPTGTESSQFDIDELIGQLFAV
ncbi:SsgA family sporulation/cell division regulator [Nocardioides guangzhouensis]|uniref:SsgA family sporulation/cell division regulator n=2 Tax=Nocardioides guangzhouensis TaxID=2497878 RepID=A0A4Q4ZBE3_9ACTN|nr:SsgA family sporulation/cell division regulator [Nocardioides guangzhouensis]